MFDAAAKVAASSLVMFHLNQKSWREKRKSEIVHTYTWKPFVLCFGVEPSKRNPFQNKGHLGFRYILTQSHAILFEYGIVHLTEGAVETPKEKAADTAKQDFTDATVAFEAKSKCILAAILVPFCEFPKNCIRLVDLEV